MPDKQVASNTRRATEVLAAEIIRQHHLQNSYVTPVGQMPDLTPGDTTVLGGIWAMQNPNANSTDRRVRSVIATSSDAVNKGVNVNMNTQGLVAHTRAQLAKVGVVVKGPGDTIGYPFKALISVTPNWVQGRVDPQSNVALVVKGKDGTDFWTWGKMYSGQPIKMELALDIAAQSVGQLEPNTRSENILLAESAPTTLARVGGSASGNADISFAGFTIE